MSDDPYEEIHRRSLDDPHTFWAEAAKGIDWIQPAQLVLDAAAEPLARWFIGGTLNTCYNAVDRHVAAGHGDRRALIYDSPVTGSQRSYSYRELQDEVARAAGVLRALGVQKGDRVLVYMPMVPEAVVSMLACARIGAVHSVVFGGFAPKELAVRIDDAQPRVIVTATCGIEPTRVIEYIPLLDEALEIAGHLPEACLVLQREQVVVSPKDGRDHDWAQCMRDASPADCVEVAATDPLYILYTSGTTGIPKGVVRDNGGHAVALRYSMSAVYGVEPGEVFWAASDIGWVVGHSYIVYAPLLHGCTTVLYEGKPVGTPDAGAFWRVIAEHGVDVLFTAPTAFRAIKRDDPDAKLLAQHDLSRFRTLFLAGERADPDTVAWAEQALGVPVIDHWWQTETGWPIAATCLGIEPRPVKHGSAGVAVPGFDVRIVDEDGALCAPGDVGETGNVVVKLPLPPGCLSTLWQNDEGCRAAYVSQFPGYYQTGDAGRIDEDGNLWVMGRTDDIINVAGHRLSTGGMEEVLAGHPLVAECAVIGVEDALKGHVPIGFVVLKAGAAATPEEVSTQLVERVREMIGPVAAFKKACVIGALPKTRSGKILRGVMRKIVDGEDYAMPATIEDAATLDGVAEAARGMGYLGGAKAL